MHKVLKVRSVEKFINPSIKFSQGHRERICQGCESPVCHTILQKKHNKTFCISGNGMLFLSTDMHKYLKVRSVKKFMTPLVRF